MTRRSTYDLDSYQWAYLKAVELLSAEYAAELRTTLNGIGLVTEEATPRLTTEGEKALMDYRRSFRREAGISYVCDVPEHRDLPRP